VVEAGERLLVAAGAGALELVEVQAAGKRALEAAEFLRGARLTAGERLNG
jgi:methionyl-tRNA formyltransferase